MPDTMPDTHPSFGTISLHTIRAAPPVRLFQSDLAHPTAICLTIHEASRHRNLSQDWVHGGNAIVEVWMSHAQFAEAITTPNHGSGIPCTIKARTDMGSAIPDPPYRASERTRVQDEFANSLVDVQDKLNETLAALDAMLSAKTPSKSAIREVAETLRRATQHFAANSTFKLDQFHRAADQTVSEMKAEVEAFIESKVRATGIAALRDANTNLLESPEQGE